jgi:hypothetical protein
MRRVSFQRLSILLVLTQWGCQSARLNDPENAPVFCARAVPGLERELADRAVASDDSTVFTADSEQSSLRWKKWAERRLSETQALMDVVEDDSRFRDSRPSLSRIADELVATFGYAEARRAEKVRASLSRVRAEIASIREKFCSN